MKRSLILKKIICTVMSGIIMVAPTWSFAGVTNMSALGNASQSENGNQNSEEIPTFVDGVVFALNNGKAQDTPEDAQKKERMAKFGKDAQAFAKESAKSFQKKQPTLNGDDLVIETTSGKKVTVDQNKLTKEDGHYYYSREDIQKAADLSGSPADLNNQGDKAKEGLYEHSQSEDLTFEGQAYKIVTDMTKRHRPDLSSDPIFDNTKKTIENLNEILGGLGDCSSDSIIKNQTSTKHISDYKECTQVLDRSGSCMVDHNYSAGVIQHYDGPYNIALCGPNCTQLWIGKVGDNYWSGWCKVYEQWTRVKVRHPRAIKKAVLEYAKWDDYMQVLIGPPGQEKIVWAGPYGVNVFPPETAGSCELNTSWQKNPNVDVTKYFKDISEGSVVSFKIRASVAGKGEAFGRIRVTYDTEMAVKDDGWSPNSCIETAYAIDDGFAKGKARCIKMPNLQSNGCALIEGVQVCNKDLKPSPIKGIPPLCQRVEITSDFDFYEGRMSSWKDSQGNIQTPYNHGGELDTCKQYEKNPKCSFVRSQCTDGAQGASGLCYVNDVTYDCGEDVKMDTSTVETNYKCPGGVACMGTECLDPNQTVSTSFAQVTALLNALQYMTQDMVCTGLDGDDKPTTEEDVTCSVFAGKPGECKRAVGGVSDCCEPTPGIGVGSYITMIRATADLDSALNDLTAQGGGEASFVKDIAGQWVDMKGEAATALKDGLSYINKDFASYIDNISGLTEKSIGDEIAKMFFDKTVEDLKKEIAKQLAKMFKDAGLDGVADAIGGGTAGEAGEAGTTVIGDMAGAAMQVFAVVAWVYAVYVIATMIIQAVWACEDDEYEMVSQRELGNCKFIGSYCKKESFVGCVEKRQVYCCYQSPLSRIMNEQIRLQGDILGAEYDGFGDPRNPRCAGIPLSEVGKVDWDRVDLSEWMAILEKNNKMPNDETISIEQLTGKGSKMDIDGTRLDTIERTLERLEEVDADAIRTEASKRLEPDTGYVNK